MPRRKSSDASASPQELDALEAAMRAVFDARGYKSVELQIIQDAHVFIEHLGEEMRHRMFTFAGPAGQELCLRPEQTIPACQQWIVENGNGIGRLQYGGPVFRIPDSTSPRPYQFRQMGAELIGEGKKKSDAELLSVTIEAVRAGGVSDFTLKIGDLEIFADFVDALDIPAQWRRRLKRHFWRAGYFDGLIQSLSRGVTSDAQRLLAHLGTLDESEARPAFEGLMDLFGSSTQTGRTREEIVERLVEQAADAAALKLDHRIADQLARLLNISAPAKDALAQLKTLTKDAGVKLDAALGSMQARLDTLADLGIADDRVSFVAHFGRNMEYYSGFVFEIWSRDAEGPVQIAGGGRYDTLLESLGAEGSMPAIGCAIRSERVMGAKRATTGAP
ncbi:MAG: hypothetical protein GC166_10035 [Alphaproteobacteria bacterium]|nr:hypothetical protein [Alphaproteobacteria bacterium]